MAELSTKLVWRVHGGPPGGSYGFFFFSMYGSECISGDEIFIEGGSYFYQFSKKLAESLIDNSYTNKKTCGSPSNTRKRQISHILETATTHATYYYGGKLVCTEKYK